MSRKEQYIKLINKNEIQADSYVKATWERDGIFVDFYYDPEGYSELCYCLRYDESGEKPSEQGWEEAQSVARMLGKEFSVDVVIEKENR